MNISAFGLTAEQTEILLNMEYYKTLYDIQNTKLLINSGGVKYLKQEWLDEWKGYLTIGFARFLKREDTKLHWYTEDELIKKIENSEPQNVWYRLVLLEAMLFEPYFPLSLEKDEPSKKYNGIRGYKPDVGDNYLDSVFAGVCYPDGFIKKFRKCFNKTISELKENKNSLAVAARIAAHGTTVALTGSDFAGLSETGYTGAVLAYIGSGVITVGKPQTVDCMVVAGGGSVLQLDVERVEQLGKETIVLESAKLITAVKEIFLNGEKDLSYSDDIFEAYTQTIVRVEKWAFGVKSQAVAKSIASMKAAKTSLIKIISSFDY